MFVREAAPELPRRLRPAVTPLWGALKFVRAVGVLHAPWAAERAAWAIPAVRHQSGLDVPHALAVAPGEAAPPTTNAALITHTVDLAGHVPVRELQAAARL